MPRPEHLPVVTEIEQLWPDDEGREQLWRFYELAHRANNQKLHLSSFSLNRVVQAREPDTSGKDGPALDLQRIAAVRNAVGESIELVVDANCAFSVADARCFLYELDDPRLTIEQACATIEELAALRTRRTRRESAWRRGLSLTYSA
jgi:L-alanine-DL-glutamate epimerase-like enolase superfamily enzyme